MLITGRQGSDAKDGNACLSGSHGYAPDLAGGRSRSWSEASPWRRLEVNYVTSTSHHRPARDTVHLGKPAGFGVCLEMHHTGWRNLDQPTKSVRSLSGIRCSVQSKRGPTGYGISLATSSRPTGHHGAGVATLRGGIRLSPLLPTLLLCSWLLRTGCRDHSTAIRVPA